jgi:hypothetical protein
MMLKIRDVTFAYGANVDTGGDAKSAGFCFPPLPDGPFML